MRQKKWKIVVSWLLVIAILSGYGNTVLAAEISEEVSGTELLESIAETTEDLATEDLETEDLETEDLATEDLETEDVNTEGESENKLQEDAAPTVEEAYETVEARNPFEEQVEYPAGASAIAAVSYGEFEQSFSDQLTDPLTLELYALMEDSFADQKLQSMEAATLENQVVFTATLTENGDTLSIDQDEEYEAAVEQLTNSFKIAFAAFYMDHPEVFWLKGMGLSMTIGATYTTGTYMGTGKISKVGFSVAEYYDSAWEDAEAFAEVTEAYTAAVAEAKTEVEALAGSSSRYELLKEAHDWLCEKLSYNTQAAQNMGSSAYYYAHSSSTSFLGYEETYAVVCEGYAKAFKVLCDLWEIPCALVTGIGGTGSDQGPHMWNAVQMEDGNWYGADVTWDDQSSVMDTYFLAGSTTEGFNGGAFGEQHIEDTNLASSEGTSLYSFVFPALAETAYEKPAYEETEDGWKLAYTLQEEATTATFETLEELAAALEALENTAVQISNSVNQPAQIAAEILEACAKQGLDLEFKVSDEAAQTEYIWQFQGLSYEEGEEAEAFDLGVEWTGEDESIPEELREAAYLKITAAGTLPDCSSAMLTIQKAGIATELEKSSALYGWEQTDSAWTCTGSMTLGTADAISLSLQKGTNVYVLSDYVGVEKVQEGQTQLWISDSHLGHSLTEEQVEDILQRRMEEKAWDEIYILSAEDMRVGIQAADMEEIIWWIFEGLSEESGQEAESFSLRAEWQAEDVEIPDNFVEGTYLYITVDGELPACGNAWLRIEGEGIASGYAGNEAVYQWLQTDNEWSYGEEITFDTENYGWIQLHLQTDIASYLIGPQADFGWEEGEEEDGQGEDGQDEDGQGEGGQGEDGQGEDGQGEDGQGEDGQGEDGQGEDGQEDTWTAGWNTDSQGRLCYLDPVTGELLVGWHMVEGVKYWFDTEGYLGEGPLLVNGSWYLLGSYAESAHGLLTGYPQVYEGNTYYASADGILLTGWQKIDSQWHYFSGDEDTIGQELEVSADGNWVTFAETSANGDFAGRRYYFKNGTTLQSGWQTIDSQKYRFHSEGYVLTGWFVSGSSAYYLDEAPETLGVMCTGQQEINGRTYYLNSKGVLQYGWQKLDGAWRYFSLTDGHELAVEITPDYWVAVTDDDLTDGADEGGCYYLKNGTSFAKGWTTVQGESRYFDSDGRLCEFTSLGGNWYELGGYRYYIKSGKKPSTGWQTISQQKYYFDSDGRMLTGEFQVKGKWYRTWDDATKEDYGSICTGWQKINGETYYFKSSGQCATGIVTIDKQKYCFDEYGRQLFGKQTVSGKDYFFAEDSGILQKGLITASDADQSGSAVYYTGTKEYMLSGWQSIDGEWRYFDPDTKAECTSAVESAGWQTVTLPDKTTAEFYFKLSKNKLTLATGWLTLEDGKYYLDKAEGKRTGICAISKKNYLFDGEGRLVTTQLTIGDTTYYTNSSGVLLNGWKTVNKQKYYYNQGIRGIGITKIGSKFYYFNQQGIMQTGLVTTREGDAYYFNSNGAQATGWKKLDGVWNYFRSSDGKLMDVSGSEVYGTNWYKITDNDVTNIYYFKKGTTLAKGYVTVDKVKYYFDSNGVLQTGWYYNGTKLCYSDPGTGAVGSASVYGLDGGQYYLNSNGQAQTGWKTISKQKYYFAPDTGKMQTGFVTISGKTYYLSEEAGTYGQRQTGSLELDQNQDDITEYYYLNSSGQVQTGWKKVSGEWNYYALDNGQKLDHTLVPESGLAEVKTNYAWYQVTEDGETKWFCLYKSSKILTGLQKIGAYRYYFDATGALYRDEFYVSSKFYYSDSETGAINTAGLLRRVTGTAADGSAETDYYYYNGKGQRQTGWKTIDGNKYYFSVVSGKAYKGGSYYVGSKLYIFNEEGVLQSGL